MQLRVKIGSAAACSVLLATLVGQPAAFASGWGGTGGTGSSGGGSSSCSFPDITINGQSIQSQISCSGHSRSGGNTGIAVNWTPPTCWWEPRYTTAEFLEEYKRINFLLAHTGADEDDPQAVEDFHNYYGPQLQNDDSTGKWYEWACSNDATIPEEEDTGIPSGWPWRWIDNGTPEANGGTVLNDETLAEIAAQTLHIPDLTVNSSPTNLQTVNLPTWFSVGKASAGKQSSTASLAAFNMSVTVTAVPTALNISVTGPDAETNPSTLTCAVNKNGTIGNVISGGGTGSSACSLTFLHATTTSPDILNASLVWSVNYNGSGAGWPKQVTVNAPERDITVNEVQTVNNG